MWELRLALFDPNGDQSVIVGAWYLHTLQIILPPIYKILLIQAVVSTEADATFQSRLEGRKKCLCKCLIEQCQYTHCDINHFTTPEKPFAHVRITVQGRPLPITTAIPKPKLPARNSKSIGQEDHSTGGESDKDSDSGTFWGSSQWKDDEDVEEGEEEDGCIDISSSHSWTRVDINEEVVAGMKHNALTSCQSPPFNTDYYVIGYLLVSIQTSDLTPIG
ncbi:hypothetical protein BC835DRAFT_1311244 [Cytidiella melzeri]|nr:hypothetical protein BC835DRAFT_1311244 [Cytidiella melzeri]